MSREENRTKLCDFLDSICPIDGIVMAETDETVLFSDSGLIDSLAMLEIVSYLEQSFGIDFSHVGIDPDNMGSVGRILDMIERETG